MDKVDRYEIIFEIPGIDKDKVDIKATRNHNNFRKTIRKTKEKGKNYVYSERS